MRIDCLRAYKLVDEEREGPGWVRATLPLADIPEVSAECVGVADTTAGNDGTHGET